MSRYAARKQLAEWFGWCAASLCSVCVEQQCMCAQHRRLSVCRCAGCRGHALGMCAARSPHHIQCCPAPSGLLCCSTFLLVCCRSPWCAVGPLVCALSSLTPSQVTSLHSTAALRFSACSVVFISLQCRFAAALLGVRQAPLSVLCHLSLQAKSPHHIQLLLCASLSVLLPSSLQCRCAAAPPGLR
jgi:hypothetical protein